MFFFLYNSKLDEMYVCEILMNFQIQHTFIPILVQFKDWKYTNLEPYVYHWSLYMYNCGTMKLSEYTYMYKRHFILCWYNLKGEQYHIPSLDNDNTHDND